MGGYYQQNENFRIKKIKLDIKASICKLHSDKAEYFCKTCKWIMCNSCLSMNKSIPDFSDHDLALSLKESEYSIDSCLIHGKEKLIF